jgi:pimeloyl-ACP methyl ester carboxylesterase
LPIHMTKPPAPTGLPLIVYATGDAGWKRGDRQTFDQLTSWGYPVACFGSREYLKHLGRGVKTITPMDLAHDYASIIDFAESQMGISNGAAVILVGVSRGAGLSVAAAAQDAIKSRIKGVVAIALTREEEYLDMYALYDHLPSIGSIPLAVVQSTHDNYLPAAQARELFGPDSERRQFHAIAARNHNFSDARVAMYNAIRASLTWIDDRL